MKTAMSVALAATFFLSGCITVATESPVKTLTIRGEATVLVPANYAVLSVAVNTEGATPIEALQFNNTLMRSVRAAIEAQGIPAQNIAKDRRRTGRPGV